MTTKTPQHFLSVSIIVVSILALLIFRPFLYTLLLAVTFAVVCWPLYEKILHVTRNKKSPAAFLTTIIVVVFIITPLTFLGFQLFQEAWQLYASVTQDGGGNIIITIKNFMDNAREAAHLPVGSSPDINQYLKDGLTWLIDHFGLLFASIAQIILHSLLFVFAFYYVLRDGIEIRKKLMALSPLSDADDEVIFNKLHAAINSVVRGNLLVALVQGGITGIGFLIFGIPNPLLWATIGTITALVPAIGTSLVVIPAALSLFLNGNTPAAIGLLIWGIGLVGLIDNILRPKLMQHGIQVHPLLILLSVLGGIASFGPIGFLLGPLTMSLLFALVETYFSLSKKG